jgi:hypothetical protein
MFTGLVERSNTPPIPFKERVIYESDLLLEDVELLYEGYNKEAALVFKEHQKKYNEKIKDIKKDLRDRDYDKAKKDIDDADKIVSDFKKALNALDDSTITSDLISVPLAALFSIARNSFGILTAFGINYIFGGLMYNSADTYAVILKKGKEAFIKFVKGRALKFKFAAEAATLAWAFCTITESISKMIEEFRSGEKGVNVFNFYRTELLKTCDTMHRVLNQFRTKL